MESLSLYLHIPFCRQRCSYCDFNTYTSVGELQTAYAAALAQEIRQVARLANGRSPNGRLPIHTIFFGGGTPSIMTLPEVEMILTAAADNFALAAGAEITLEANPESVDLTYLSALRRLGVNRLSFGAQSAIPEELALLERTHDFTAVTQAVAMSRRAGFENISLDLIYGLPGQSLPSWEKSMKAALALAPEHLSLYCLTIEPGTPMQRWLNNGRISSPDPDLAADQYELACDQLAKAGFVHYEISNWARPGRACAHNLTYWRTRPYLGLGAGAHGFVNGVRYQVVKQPRVYIRRLAEKEPGHFPLSAAVADHYRVARKEAMSDIVITQLRLLQEGLDLAEFAAQFGQTLDAAFDGLVADLTEWGMVRTVDGRLLLTEHGRFLSNQVFYRFME